MTQASISAHHAPQELKRKQLGDQQQDVITKQARHEPAEQVRLHTMAGHLDAKHQLIHSPCTISLPAGAAAAQAQP